METEIRQINGSLALVIPLEMAASLEAKDGDKVFVTTGPKREFLLTRKAPSHEQMMAFARDGMRQYHNALAELAK